MNTEEPRANSNPKPDSSSPPGTAEPVFRGNVSVQGGLRLPLWLLTAGAGLVAGCLSWAGGEATFDKYKIADAMVYPPNYKQIGGYQKVAVQAEIEGAAQIVVERKKAVVAFGLLGLVLGLVLGLTGGLASGEPRSALGGALGGGAVGAAAGAGLSMALVPLFYRYQDPESGGLLELFITHCGIFAGIGAAAGLALAWGLGSRTSLGRALFGGVLGALAGTFIFEAINSLAFPLMRTYEPVPSEQLPRLVVHLCVAVFTALIAGLAAGTPPRKEARLPVE
jgi:hypothetical protein